jgi:hypothetical protein
MTGPFVGKPWTPNFGWPTINGISGDRNYLEHNNYLVDPQTQIMPYNFRNGWAQGGGKSRRRKVGGWRYSSSTSSSTSSEEDKKPAVVGKGLKGKKHVRKSKKSKGKTVKRGGGLIPQPLVNVTNDVMFNLNSAYSALNGQQQPVNPSPYMDQMTQKPTLM